MISRIQFPIPILKEERSKLLLASTRIPLSIPRVWVREKGILYQSLINLYLRERAQANRDLKLEWQ